MTPVVVVAVAAAACLPVVEMPTSSFECLNKQLLP